MEKLPLEKLPDVMRVRDVMCATGLGRQKVYELVGTQEIPSKRVGKQFIVYKPNFIKWLQSNEAC
jgi:predicted DNA-binding transcriptional regulator AlpA